MNFSAVCFDCDSTLSRIEGIDELARRQGLFEQVAALTDAAMNGDIALESVYGKRLELIQPNRAAIDWLAQLYIAEMVEGAAETVAALLAQNIEVHIVSGGLRQAILPLAAHLGVAEDRVHAVDIEFNDRGDYLAFNASSPLAGSGGKARICRRLRMRHA